ncbi:hypothetical protein K2Z84_03315 [Candidatus Binatia bacterium]|nr:hypothetical protein [Candidatus Binatia bacterium]
MPLANLFARPRSRVGARAVAVSLAVLVALCAGCASTTVTVTPSPQAPVCDPRAAALVLWAPEWRPDQKDVPEREAAAAAGLDEFFRRSGCFARSELRRTPDLAPPTVAAQLADTRGAGPLDVVVAIAVRELGPTVKLLASPALVDGGTEVVLQVSVFVPPEAREPRTFTIHWQDGGPGVVKGVASLPRDMQEALAAGLLRGGAESP